MLSYQELVATTETYEERYAYLTQVDLVNTERFGSLRHLNQSFYQSREWKLVRSYVITRDKEMDLGLRPTNEKLVVHHMNPITPYDLKNNIELCLDPNYLITVSTTTHNFLHSGVRERPIMVKRKPGDTLLWKKIN